MANWNLAPSLPDDAYNLWQDYRTTYPTVDGTDLAARAGDLGARIEAEQGALVDLGTGNTYEITTPVSISGSGVWGVTGTNNRIYYSGRDSEYLFRGSGPDAVLEGVTFDITEDPSATTSTDIGLINYTTAGEFWAQDVTLAGQRHRYQDGQRRGGRYTWKVQGSRQSATVFVENLSLPDGDRTVTGTPNGFHDHCQGVTQEWDNEGLLVYKGCTVANFNDNNFYVSTGTGDYARYRDLPGRVVIWDSYSADCRGACFRVGQNDAVIGGTAEMFNSPTYWDGPGQGVMVDHGSPEQITGVTCRGDTYGRELLGTRSSAVSATFDRCVVDAAGSQQPLNFSGDDQVELIDCYIFDDYPGSGRLAMHITRSDVDATDIAIQSEFNREVYLQSGSTFRHNGQSFSPGQLTNFQIGAPDPRPLPEPYFDYAGAGTGGGSSRSHDRTFVVRDIETGERLPGDIYVYRDRELS